MAWSDFGYDILVESLAVLLGIILGVPLGLLVDRLIKQKQRKELKKITLRLILEELEHNQKLVNQLIKEVLKGVTFYQLDFRAWQSTSTTAFETIDNSELKKQLFKIYYEFEHLQRKLDRRFEFFFSSAKALTEFSNMQNVLQQAIYKHLHPIKDMIEEAIKLVNNEL